MAVVDLPGRNGIVLTFPPLARTKPSALRWGGTAPGDVPALDRPLVMGVLNVTPDSFSDGGRFFDPDKAADHALARWMT